MTTIREAARRVDEDLANAEVPPLENRAPPQGNQVLLKDKAPVIPPPMTDGEISSTFLSLAQVMTIQAQAMTA